MLRSSRRSLVSGFFFLELPESDSITDDGGESGFLFRKDVATGVPEMWRHEAIEDEKPRTQ